MLRFIAQVVIAVILASTYLLGVAGTVFDARDALDTVTLWGWTRFELLFVLMGASFWVVVGSLYLRVRKLEKKQPRLSLVPLSYSGDNLAYLEVHNKGGYVPNCIANVKSISLVSVQGKRVSLDYLRGQTATLQWENSGRTMNMPNDGVRRRLKVAQLFSGGWRFPDVDGRQYPAGRYKIDIVLSFESETTYVKTISVALGCKYDTGRGALSIHVWEDWLEGMKRGSLEVTNGHATV